MFIQKRYLILFPIAGVVCFLCLYLGAALLYPGGSQHDLQAVGFSWTHNYWCNLLNETGMNGKSNPGQPLALVAMVILSLSLAMFWYLLPTLVSTGFVGRRAVQLSGILAFLPFVFIPWGGHDLMMYLSGVIGAVAITGTLTAVYLKRWYWLFAIGIVCVLLIVLNNIFYHSVQLIQYLPIIQKISFLVFLAWICFVASKLYHLSSRQAHN